MSSCSRNWSYTSINVSFKSKSIKKGVTLVRDAAPESAEKATEHYVNKGINKLDKKFTKRKGSGITLAKNEIKDIMKIVRSP